MSGDGSASPARLLVGAVAAMGIVFAGYLVLANQTPYCYVERVYEDGRVERKEFSSEIAASRYEARVGFGSDHRGVVSEASGCGSDRVYEWEAAGAATLAVAAAGVALVAARAKTRVEVGKALAKMLLAALTVVSLVSAVGFGAFAAPVLVPFLWFAAADASRWLRFAWTGLAGLCAFLFGILVAWHVDGTTRGGPGVWLPATLAVVVTVAFLVTTRNAGGWPAGHGAGDTR